MRAEEIHIESHSSLEESIVADGPNLVAAPAGGIIAKGVDLAVVQVDRDGRYLVRAHVVATGATAFHNNAQLFVERAQKGTICTSALDHPEAEVFVDAKSGQSIRLVVQADDNSGASYVTTQFGVTCVAYDGCNP